MASTTLILGDENFTFVLPFLESRHHSPDEVIEIAVCLPEDKLPDDFRPNYLSVNSQGIKIHFGINPAQLRNHFFSGEYDRIIFVLPGIATTGFPEFLDKKHDMLFRLRIHMYFFGFLKSSRSALKGESGIVQLLWPTQAIDGQLGPEIPWHGVEINKIGPFCDIHRRSDFDEVLEIEKFGEWRPLVHGVATEGDSYPDYLANCTFYAWSLTPSVEPPAMLPEAGDPSQHKDQNLLFVPPQLWSHSAESIPHVNDLFNFQLPTNVPEELLVVSKPTLKFDPRFRSDGPANRTVARRPAAPGVPPTPGGGSSTTSAAPTPGPAGRGRRLPPPPPPPMDSPVAPPEFYGEHCHAHFDPTTAMDLERELGLGPVSGETSSDNLFNLHEDVVLYEKKRHHSLMHEQGLGSGYRVDPRRGEEMPQWNQWDPMELPSDHQQHGSHRQRSRSRGRSPRQQWRRRGSPGKEDRSRRRHRSSPGKRN